MLDKLHTRREVARYAGRCEHWVRRQELKGLLPRVELSRRTIRYRESDVAKLIDRLTVGGGAL